MPQSKASHRRRKGNDRRFKQNGVLDPIRHNGVAHMGGRGIARGGASGFVRCEGDLPGPEHHPEIQLRDEEAPLAEQIEEITTLPFYRVQHLIKACNLPQHVELQERTVKLAYDKRSRCRSNFRGPQPSRDLRSRNKKLASW